VVDAEAVGRDQYARLNHHRHSFCDVLDTRPLDPALRFTTEIVAVVWCRERSSAPLLSRPISVRYYLSPIVSERQLREPAMRSVVPRRDERRLQ
jgi:hypothetical protein